MSKNNGEKFTKFDSQRNCKNKCAVSMKRTCDFIMSRKLGLNKKLRVHLFGHGCHSSCFLTTRRRLGFDMIFFVRRKMSSDVSLFLYMSSISCSLQSFSPG
jgi:hypothetical protein